MITLDFNYEEFKDTHTFETTCVASGGKPFVKTASNIFLNIASPADMLLIPDAPSGGMHRDDTVTMIFRDSDSRKFTVDNMEEQIGSLNEIDLSSVNDVVLYSNTP